MMSKKSKSSIKKKKKKRAKPELWTPEQDRALVKMHNMGLSAKAVVKKLNKQFGSKRNDLQLRSRISRIRTKIEAFRPGELDGAVDSKTGRLKIPRTLLTELHRREKGETPEAAAPPKKPSKKKAATRKKRGKLAAPPWAIKHDRLLVSLYNTGSSSKEMSKTMKKTFPEKRSSKQCSHRIANIRLKVLGMYPDYSQKTSKDGRKLVTEDMLRIYHGLPRKNGSPAKATPKPKPREKKVSVPIPATPEPKVVSNGLHKAKLDLDDGSMTITLEGKFAESKTLKDKVAKLISEAAVVS